MSSPQVGDVLTTSAQLDACPTGTIVRKNDHWIFVRVNGEWDVTGAYSSRTSDGVFDVVDEVTVIWVPPVTRAEITTDTWIIDDGEVTFPRVPPELLGLVRSVLVGGRVRVTVEKIGNDDE